MIKCTCYAPPPPPPPPPPPLSFIEKSTDWVAEHKWTSASIGLGLVIGAGILTAYGSGYYKAKLRRNRVRPQVSAAGGSKERRQVIGE